MKLERRIRRKERGHIVEHGEEFSVCIINCHDIIFCGTSLLQVLFFLRDILYLRVDTWVCL